MGGLKVEYDEDLHLGVKERYTDDTSTQNLLDMFSIYKPLN